MDYAQEIASVLREVSSETHNTRLELIIILLIAVEVVFELRRVFLERQPDGSRPGQQHQHQQHQHWHSTGTSTSCRTSSRTSSRTRARPTGRPAD